MKKTISLILSASLCLSLFAGCNNDKKNTESTDSIENATVEFPMGEVVIGSILSLSGDGSTCGNAQKEGIDLAVEQINNNGGIKGQKLVVNVEDDKSDSGEAKKLYQNLDEKTVALIGSSTSSTSTILAELSAKDNLPMIAPSASITDFTKDKKSVFQLTSSDLFQADIMVQTAANEMKAQKFAVLYNEDNSYSVDQAEQFALSVEFIEIDQISKVSYKGSETQFKDQMKTLSDFGSDVLFIPDYQENVINVITAAKDAGLTSIYLGGDSWDQIAENYPDQKDLLEGSYYITDYDISNSSAFGQAFVTSYEEKYDSRTPGMFAAQAYDSVYMFQQAFETAGTTESEKTIEALSAISFSGASGSYKFSSDRIPSKNAYILKITDGKGTYFEKVYQTALPSSSKSA